jgi:hypothetical protein
MPKLTELPDEVLILILAPLNLASAYAALSTCKYINNLFKVSPKLQYGLELQAAEFLDNLYCTGSLSSRLIQLKDYEQAWRKLSWSQDTVPVPQPHGGYFDLSGGQYILGHADGIPVRHQHQGTTRAIWSFLLSDHDHGNVQNGPRINGQDWHSAWQSFDIGEDVLDFGMSVSEHDLIGAVTTFVQVRSVFPVQIY